MGSSVGSPLPPFQGLGFLLPFSPFSPRPKLEKGARVLGASLSPSPTCIFPNTLWTPCSFEPPWPRPLPAWVWWVLARRNTWEGSHLLGFHMPPAQESPRITHQTSGCTPRPRPPPAAPREPCPGLVSGFLLSEGQGRHPAVRLFPAVPDPGPLCLLGQLSGRPRAGMVLYLAACLFSPTHSGFRKVGGRGRGRTPGTLGDCRVLLGPRREKRGAGAPLCACRAGVSRGESVEQEEGRPTSVPAEGWREGAAGLMFNESRVQGRLWVGMWRHPSPCDPLLVLPTWGP